jgi:outer membrane protein assembly factor BamB
MYYTMFYRYSGLTEFSQNPVIFSALDVFLNCRYSNSKDTVFAVAAMIATRRIFGIILTFLTLITTLSAQTVPLLSQADLDPYALKRDWFHQLKLQHTNAKIQHALLEGKQLFLTTSDAKLHVLNAETGQWLWTRSIGNNSIALTEPAVNSRIVAIHNNLNVFLFNRQTGKQLLQLPLPESAAAACEMSEHYLYVPMVNQTILGFVLREALSPEPESTAFVQTALATLPDNTDDELKKIVKQFEETKRSLRAAEPEKTGGKEFILDSTHRIPITCAAMGSLRTKPLLLSQYYTWKKDEEENPTHEVDKITHQEFLSWVTEEGFLYTASMAGLSERAMQMVYRVDSAGQTFYMNSSRTAHVDRPGSKSLPQRPVHSQVYPINVPEGEKVAVPEVVITGGRASYVFAIDARSGDVRWQFPAQGQLLESIAVVGKDVYAPTSTGRLHALDLETGKEKEEWLARNVRNVKRFVAASRNRLYVLDRQDRLVCLDRASGASIFVYDIRRFDHCHFNLETDQILLITDGGLVQCLRERDFSEESGELESGVLRHRISSVEYAETVRGGDMPTLWWIE